ncbi:hypothetical protein TSAR_005762 [Trichomalopsis sarcophagae]|uniref:Mutator-like transposase domain-containing protein n=1 Tax=Trichomalopsis sarcophagae TaxID=543379 RepID=A0A232EDI3_9HYME|nr:hypothetical protein TSAR_005762 [Trichomalopsis sarcophagae]
MKKFMDQKNSCDNKAHVQKRFGTQLRNLKKNKKLGGKGKLTDKIIDLLPTYYGNAIRAHLDSIEDMTRTIWAIFYHKASTDKKLRRLLRISTVDDGAYYKQ